MRLFYIRCTFITCACNFSFSVASTYNRVTAKKFLSATNWCLPEHDFDSECLEDVLPESHQVPCKYDDVIFPELASFYVDMNTPPSYEIRSIRIGYTVSIDILPFVCLTLTPDLCTLLILL